MMIIINPTFAIVILMMVMLLLLVVIMIISAHERGNAGTNHRRSAVRKGAASRTMFHTFLSFSVV